MGAASATISINLLYRSASHLMLWHVVEGAGYWERLGATVTFTSCGSPSEAEERLIAEDADFVSGNHITPYLRKHEGVPLVCIAQPWRHVTDVVVSRKPLGSLADLRSMSVADRPLRRSSGAVFHPSGNHLLYLERAGLDPFRDIIRDEQTSLRAAHDRMDYVAGGGADATFVPAHDAAAAAERGLSVLHLDPLPMIHGPTVTAYAPHIRRHPEKTTTALKGLAFGIHFFRTRPDDTKAILHAHYPDKSGAGVDQTYADVAAMLAPSMYPDLRAVLNAFRLCEMSYGERVAGADPIAVWDVHYLRQLDDEGFFRSLDADLERSPT